MQVDEAVIHDTERYAADGYPWAEWDLLRDEAPVYWYERDNIVPFWAVTRYEDVKWISGQNTTFINGGGRLRLARRRSGCSLLDEVPPASHRDRLGSRRAAGLHLQGPSRPLGPAPAGGAGVHPESDAKQVRIA